LEAYRLAHNYGEDEAFGKFFEAFLDETLIFLEERYISKNSDRDLISEMEDFMNHQYAKKEN